MLSFMTEVDLMDLAEDLYDEGQRSYGMEDLLNYANANNLSEYEFDELMNNLHNIEDYYES